jgi:hypothetical protein
MAKTTKPTEAAKAETVQVQPPLVQTLALMGNPRDGFMPIRVITRGKSVLGYEHLTTSASLDLSLGLDVLSIYAMKLYMNRQGFAESVDESKLRKGPLSLHSMGVARLPTGLYAPISLKIEGDTVVGTASLFSAALALVEALSVFRVKFTTFFVDRKVFIP